MITDAKKNITKQSGQAVLEFVLFLPFMMMMYFTILSMGNSINGSINQQKITRGFFYYRAANNSMIPRPRRDGNEPSAGWRVFGMQIMGWAESFEGSSNNPVAPCYKFQLPLADEEGECNEAYSDTTTQLIRVQTVYGMCGATYTKDPTTRNNRRHPQGDDPRVPISAQGCVITN